jgi:osmotically-inducible protein OsmY
LGPQRQRGSAIAAGSAQSPVEREEAERAAGPVPGVSEVKGGIGIGSPELAAP